MDDLTLIRPNHRMETDFRAAIAEFRAQGEDNIESLFSRAGGNFKAHLQQTKQAEAGIYLAEGFVPFATFWCVKNRQHIVGFSHIRFTLTPALKIEGGHIGYSIRPSKRRKGYGTRQLALILEECRWMDMQDIMITCDYDNIGSAKIIEANGGIFSGEALSPRTNKRVFHYWIHL